MIGHSMEDLRGYGADALMQASLMNKAYHRAANPIASGMLQRLQETAATKLAGKGGVSLARFAGNPMVHKIMRYAPGLGAAGGVMGVADVLAGPDSLGNKAMDTTAMTIGGILGAAGGPLGVAAGAGVGKMASDATQWLFGDKKTAEQRKLEAALLQLNGGRF